MATLRPLPVRLVQPDWVDRVPAPAHDSLTPAERRRYLQEHPDCYLSVTRAPEDQPPGQEWDPAAAVAESRAALAKLLDNGAFTEPQPPALYLYRLATEHHSQVGIVGGVAVDDYERGVVRIHEEIKASRATHLATQLEALGVQSSPIALASRPNRAVGSTVTEVMSAAPPAIDFVSADGLRQQVWPVADEGDIEAIRAALSAENLYLIDGHHRAAAASAHRAAGGTGSDTMLCVVFSTAELRNEAFHRCLEGIDIEHLLDRLGATTDITPADGVDAVLARRPDEIPLLAGGRWSLVTVPRSGNGEGANPVDDLDPVRLQQHVLGPILGIGSAAPASGLSYKHGMADRADLLALERAAKTRDGGGAVFVMRPVPMSTLTATSDAGLTMPPKSTYFVPKVRSGLFLRHLR